MQTRKMIPVWDIATRVFHWTLAVAFFIAYLTEDDLELLHTYAGYTIIGLLVFRLVWGLVGPRYARFGNIVYRPAEIRAYLAGLLSGHPRRYIGHNPAGGLMVIALLCSLSMTCYTGLEAYADEGKGPLASNSLHIVAPAHADGNGDHERDGDEFWEEVHEVFASLTLTLVVIHIVAVLLMSLVHKENLVRAMISGRKAE